jgi:hypothetical protein
MFSHRHRRAVGRAGCFRRLLLESLELRTMLSVSMIELGPSDNIALDQPRVAVELIKDLDPDPDIHNWASVGPSIFNTFLLNTGANSVLAMATAVGDMLQPPIVYETEGLFEEVGVGGRHPMDISAAYRFDFAGTTGERNTYFDVRILSDADNDFSIFGPWGIVGMPAMADRVTTMDMRGWSGGGTGLDLYMKVFFDDQLPEGDQHRYALSVDNRLAFDPQDYLVEGDPPIWADIPFLTAIPTNGGIGQEGNFLFDTGAQMSFISSDLAIAIGLDSNGDGVLNHLDDAYLGTETIGGVGGTKAVAIFAIDEVRVPVTQVSTGRTVELIWTDLQWLVLDIDVGDEDNPVVLDGVFGSDLLTSGWFHAFFYPDQPDGYMDQVHLDFRGWGLDTGEPQSRTGTVYFDLNPGVDNIIEPGPGIRIRETLRSTEVIKEVWTDTYSIVLQTVPNDPVHITVEAEYPVMVSSDGGETFESSLVVTLEDTAPHVITVMAEDDGLIDGPRIRLITHSVASDDPDYNNIAVRDVAVKVFDNREVVTITSDQAGVQPITSLTVAEGGGEVTYWMSLASLPPDSFLGTWVQIEDPAGQVRVFNPNNELGEGGENIWVFNTSNWNQSQPVHLTAIDDEVPEGPHQTELIHTVIDTSDLSQPVVLGQQFLTVHIIDNDLGSVVITETGGGTQVTEGGATDTYQIALLPAPAESVEITVTADSQVEVSDDDGGTFVSTLVLSFTDGTPQTITVRAVDDQIAEGTHTGTITHAVTGTVHDTMYPTTLVIPDVTVTITDNDSAGLLVASDAAGTDPIDSVFVQRGGQTHYWIALTSQPKHDVTIFFSTNDEALTAVDDSNPANAFVAFTALDWNVPQVIRLAAGEEFTEAHITHTLVSSDPNYRGTILLPVAGFDPTLSAALSGGTLTIADIEPTGTPREMTVSLSGQHLVISDASQRFAEAPDGGTLSPDSRTLTIPTTLVSDSLIVELAGGVLAIDFSGGNPIPAGGLEFHGGDPASGLPGGTLVLDRGTSSGLFSTITHTLVNASDGSILLDPDGGGASASGITYTGLEPIIDGLDAAHRVFSFTGGSETIVLSDAVGPDGLSLIDSTLSESVAFASPTASLTVGTTAGSGADTIYVEGLDAAFDADLFILADQDDTVHFRTNPTDIGNGELRVTAGGIHFGTTVSAPVITLIADSIDLASGALVDAGAGTVVVQPRSPGTLFDLGGPDVLVGSPLTLGLSVAELDRIQAQTLTIGGSDGGELRITAPLARAAATDMTLVSGGGIVFDPGSIDTAGGTLVFDPGGAVQPLTAGTDATASSVSFADGAALAIRIDGTEVDTGYSQLNVAGGVDLTGAVLEISGSHLPAAGDAFTLVKNGDSDPVTGTFAGLPEGAVISDFLGSGLLATITYSGGDGNDVVLEHIGGTKIDMTTVSEPTATGDHGLLAALPDSVDWVHEWQSFWVEIWVSTPETTAYSLAKATVDLQYPSSYLTAQEIAAGPAFTEDPWGTIDHASGMVRGMGGQTARTDLGKTGHVLLARVRFTSIGGDQVPVDEEGRKIGPYAMPIVLADGQTEVHGGGVPVPSLGSSPSTELWAVMYDIDDNGQIDFGDFSYFAAAFGHTVGEPTSEPPYVWWADFDKSGRVDFGDLAFFAPNFGKTRSMVQAGDQTLVFPPNFPDAWRAEMGASGGEGQTLGGEGEASSGEAAQRAPSAGSRTWSDFDSPQRTQMLLVQAAFAPHEPRAAVLRERTPTAPWFAGQRWFAAGDESSGTERSQPESPVTLHSPSDSSAVEPAERMHRWSDRWEPLEDVLSLLAEPLSNRLPNNVPAPHDALFATLGR